MSDTMPDPGRDDLRMRTYLLGGLSDAERREMEERFFQDEDYYDHLLEVQYDLIDAYSRGSLTPDERLQVERRLLAGRDGSHRARVARGLMRVEHAAAAQAAGPAAPRTGRLVSSWLPIAASVLAVVSLAAAVWLARDNARLRDQLASVHRPVTTSLPPPPPPTPALPAVATLTLTPGVLRSDDGPSVCTVAADARLVRFVLPTAETGPAFSVEVERGGAGRIWAQGGLTRNEQGAVVVWMPGELLVAGTYEFLLSRELEGPSELAANYVCRIVRSSGP
jgi:hypothetical protein